MARFTFKLPDIGEGISEAEIVAWHVAIGDRVEEDSPIADMMTDKATVEMESPVTGVVVELAGEVGDQVSIGAALVVIETDAVEVADEVVAAPLTAAQAETAEQYEAENPGVEEVATETPSPLRGEGRGEGQPQAEPLATAPTPHPSPLPGGEREQTQTAVSPTEQKAHALASPAVRARARSRHRPRLGKNRLRPSPPRRSRRLPPLRVRRRLSPPHASRAREDQPIKVIGMRRRIAENMAASKRAIPHFTYVDEIDVTALEAMRADLNANRGGRPKLTMLPLMIVAICKTIPDFPMLNARYDDEAGVVTRHGSIHLGMAAQTDAGLTVPVIRDAQDRNVWQLATEITRLAEAARAGKLAPSEMGGGTITVTSLGPLGGIATTPVINRPEVAIIGPNKIVERPVFKGDEVVRAKLMNLSISCDHRVVDGWDAASFVQGLKKYLETPVLLFAD
ncbi:dihydrolipoamide acetyltransferase family protein [Sphingomonas aurantiaca]|uniref:dihydrolipoamide acetyltransferase family protein n=1 Tax=Sphingomonas aurantiaca TaxID=185949 RepID=UPI003A5BC1FB